MELLSETSEDVTLEESIDTAVEVLTENMSGGHAASRNAMSRTGTGGNPLVFPMPQRYDDIPEEEKTVGENDDPLEEVRRLVREEIEGLLNEDESTKQRRISSIRKIRGELEHVWQMLGKAETKLGVAKFDADEMDFTGIEKTLNTLIDNIKEIMTRIERSREQVSLT